MTSKDSSTHIPFQTTQPLNTPGGLGKEIKGNMQGTNILKRLEDDYRGKMTDGKMFEDGHVQAKHLTEVLIQEGEWQPSFQNIIDNVIGQCATCLPRHVQSAKPHGTLPKAMDFNDIISVDLKE